MSYDKDVELATSSADGSNDWEKIISFCNRVRDSVGSTAMQLALSSIYKRIKTSSNYKVQLQAITLLEACAGNCGKLFQAELTSQQSLSEIRSIITGSQFDREVVQRMKEVLASWTTEFQHEQQFLPMRQLYDKLRKEGVNFALQATRTPSSNTTSSSQNTSTTGEDDIARAIRLSLEEANKIGNTSSNSTLYPSLTSAPSGSSTSPVRKVRAIYDFDAAEDNELTFKAGEIIELIDDSDQNWWKGRTVLGTGLFPANFVSKNINKDPEPVVKATATGGQEKKKEKKVTTVSMEKIDLCLEMLKSADARDGNQAESETTKELEEECQQMRKLVEKKISQLERQEDEMEAVSKMFHEAVVTYKKLLTESSTVSTDTSISSVYGQPVTGGNQYLSSYVPQYTGEYGTMTTRLSPDLPRAHTNQPHPSALPTHTTYQVTPSAGYLPSIDNTAYHHHHQLHNNTAPPPYQPITQNAPLF